MNRFCHITMKLSVLLTIFYSIIFLLKTDLQVILYISNIRSIILLPGLVFSIYYFARNPISKWPIITLIIYLSSPTDQYTKPDYCFSASESRSPLLRIMTLNLAGSANVPERNLHAIIKKHRIDILALQEVSPGFWQSEAKILRNLLPYSVYRKSKEGYWTQALLSRQPIQSIKVRDPGSGFSHFDARLVLDTVIKAKHAPLRIFVTHLSVPFVRGDCRGLSCLLTRYNQTERDQQLSRLLRWAEQSPETVFIIGDLNVSDENPMYEIIAGGFYDSGRCNSSEKNTWPTDQRYVPAFLRIDYILMRKSPSAVYTFKSQTIPVNGSDHRAVITDVYHETAQ